LKHFLEAVKGEFISLKRKKNRRLPSQVVVKKSTVIRETPILVLIIIETPDVDMRSVTRAGSR